MPAYNWNNVTSIDCPIKWQTDIVRAVSFLSCYARLLSPPHVTQMHLEIISHPHIKTHKMNKQGWTHNLRALGHYDCAIETINHSEAPSLSSVRQRYCAFTISLWLLRQSARLQRRPALGVRCVCEVRFIAWWGSWMSLGKSIEILVWYSVLHSETPPWTIVLCPPPRRTIPHCYFCLHTAAGGQSPNNGSLFLSS